MFMNKISFIKKIDTFIGGSLCYLLPAIKYRSNLNIKKILIIRPGGIGDAVLLIPLIKEIHCAFPEAIISVLAERRNAAVFGLTPFVTKIYRYDTPHELFKVLSIKPDLLIDTEQWHRLSAIIGRVCRPLFSIGYATNRERKRLFSVAIPYSQHKYEGDSFMELLVPLKRTADFPRRPFLSVPDMARQKAGQLLKGIKPPFVTLFPGASIYERQWGSSRFKQVSEYLAKKNASTVIVGGQDEVKEAKKIAGSKLNIFNLTGKTSLPETAAIIQKSALLISADSGIMHIAVGLGISSVSLFGPGIAAKWAPRGSQHIIINKNLPCSPCTIFGNTPKCHRQISCMSAITPADVIEATCALLKRSNVLE